MTSHDLVIFLAVISGLLLAGSYWLILRDSHNPFYAAAGVIFAASFSVFLGLIFATAAIGM